MVWERDYPVLCYLAMVISLLTIVRLKTPWEEYEQFDGPGLPHRSWPSMKIKKAPRWLASDLRDGNQAFASQIVRQ